MYFETSDLKIHFLMIRNSEITIKYPYYPSYFGQHQIVATRFSSVDIPEFKHPLNLKVFRFLFVAAPGVQANAGLSLPP